MRLMPQAPISGKTALIFSHSSSLVGMVFPPVVRLFHPLIVCYRPSKNGCKEVGKNKQKQGRIARNACPAWAYGQRGIARTRQKSRRARRRKRTGGAEIPGPDVAEIFLTEEPGQSP